MSAPWYLATVLLALSCDPSKPQDTGETSPPDSADTGDTPDTSAPPDTSDTPDTAETGTPFPGVAAAFLLVVDNSPSMADTSATLGFALPGFVEGLLEAGVSGRMALTTTSAYPEGVALPGEAGRIIGQPISLDEPGAAERLQRDLFCDITPWSEPLPRDPSYNCGDDPAGAISQQYLTCLCGAGWKPAAAGNGNEEGLEATLLALCRSVEVPPSACYDNSARFQVGDEGSNGDLLDGAEVIFTLLASDEGDGSWRLPVGEDDPATYLGLFAEMLVPMVFSAMGPDYDPGTRTFTCNGSSATTWGTLRYINAASDTGGTYAPIEAEDGGDCTRMDPAPWLAEVAVLVGAWSP